MLLAGLLALAFALLLGLVIHLTSKREPSYQGKSLSEWIVPFCQQTPKGINAPGGPQYFDQLQPVRVAVAAMGTNALPFLIGKVNHKESAVHRTFRQWLDKQPLSAFKMTDPQVGRIRAIRALAVLGPVAEPAIPPLAPTVADRSLATHSIYALAAIGPNGMRALLDQWTNANPVSRMEIGMAFMSYQPPRTPAPRVFGLNLSGTNTLPADILVTGLSRIAQDQLAPLRFIAVEQLGKLSVTDSNAAAALLPVLRDKQSPFRHLAIRALASATNYPDIVLPALTNLLSDPDPGARVTAGFTLRNFGYKADFQPSFPGPQYGGHTPDGFTRLAPPVPRTNLFLPPPSRSLPPRAVRLPQTNSTP